MRDRTKRKRCTFIGGKKKKKRGNFWISPESQGEWQKKGVKVMWAGKGGGWGDEGGSLGKLPKGSKPGTHFSAQKGGRGESEKQRDQWKSRGWGHKSAEGKLGGLKGSYSFGDLGGEDWEGGRRKREVLWGGGGIKAGEGKHKNPPISGG